MMVRGCYHKVFILAFVVTLEIAVTIAIFLSVVNQTIRGSQAKKPYHRQSIYIWVGIAIFIPSVVGIVGTLVPPMALWCKTSENPWPT